MTLPVGVPAPPETATVSWTTVPIGTLVTGSPSALRIVVTADGVSFSAESGSQSPVFAV